MNQHRTPEQKHELERRNMEQHDALMNTVSDLKREIRSNTRALHGFNGDAGLVGRIDTMETQLDQVDGKIDRLTNLIIGDVDNPTDTGIKGKMQNISRLLNESKKLFWAAIATVLTGVIQLAIRWFVTVSEVVKHIPPTSTPMP